MGGPMAANLVKSGHSVCGFDLLETAIEQARKDGCNIAASAVEAAKDRDVVITILPAGKHVTSVYSEVRDAVRAGALMIDSSTIDIASAREAHEIANSIGALCVDAPVSGGIMGAINGTLTFMAGGSDESLAAAAPILEPMAGRVVNCGAATTGQAAKVCNNMILAITMIGTGEAFELGHRLGLTDQTLFDVVSTASGQSWSTTTYCPVPGPVPTSPANNDYKPGFAADLMMKDLGLSQDAADMTEAHTPLGAHALELYQQFCDNGHGGVDFFGIIKMMQAVKKS